MQLLVRQILAEITTLKQVVRRIVSPIQPALAGGAAAGGFVDPGAEACCPVPPPGAAFERVFVDNRVVGGTRVAWSLVESFADPGPYEARLQASPSGVADSDDWVDVGAPAVDPAYLVDPAQRTYGVEEVLHYRVVLVTAAGSSFVSGPVRPQPALARRDWLLFQEMGRKEQLRHTLLTGVKGYLLKARRYGVRCRCVNPVTRERTDSRCRECYGVGVVGGYHPPVPCYLADLDKYDSRQATSYQEGRGTTQDVTFSARVSPGLPVVQEDLWVGSGDDARYQVHRVWELARHRGVTLVHAAEFRRVSRSDIAYAVPVAPSSGPDCRWGASVEDDAPESVCLPRAGCPDVDP